MQTHALLPSTTLASRRYARDGSTLDVNAPIYRYQGTAVDNEFVHRSLAVLFATFFFTLNIWISDVYK